MAAQNSARTPLAEDSIRDFQEIIWERGRQLYRDMPWRQNTEPYWVLVSEIMLQQTQVDRVVPKFEAFIATFPTIQALAGAALAEVLALWSGLGYNRRARFLHEAAKMIVHEYKGAFPATQQQLMTLPGVGVNTAGAILAYSFNIPAVYIETNVRTVYFYHFFEHEAAVSDTTLRAHCEQTIDTEHPREWYWALMDYGSYLKKQGAGANAKSKHYKKQSPLKGSVREVRGQIIKQLTAQQNSTLPYAELAKEFGADTRFTPALEGLQRDGLVVISREAVQLAT